MRALQVSSIRRSVSRTDFYIERYAKEMSISVEKATSIVEFVKNQEFKTYISILQFILMEQSQN